LSQLRWWRYWVSGHLDARFLIEKLTKLAEGIHPRVSKHRVS